MLEICQLNLFLLGGESIPEHPELNSTKYFPVDSFSTVIELSTRLTYIPSFFKDKCSRIIISKGLKVRKNIIYWDHSSAGEHYAEDVGVLGSTPSGPIWKSPASFSQKDL